MSDERTRPLGWHLKSAYAGGQLVEGIANNTLSVFLLFYVTAVCGLPGALAGLALAAGMIIDAIMNPLIGSLTDGWRSRFGRRLPLMAASLLPLVVLFVLMFALPTELSDWLLAIWVAVLSSSLRVCMSFFILPYQALGVELTEDYTERSSLMTWRWLAGQCGAVLALALGFGFFFAGDDGLTAKANYTPFAFVLAVILSFGAASAIWVAHVTRGRQHSPPEDRGQIHRRAVRELVEAFRNPSFRTLFISALLFFTAMGAYLALGIHANSFFWKLEPGEIQIVTVGLFAGLVLGAPLAAPLMRRFEKAQILSAGMAGMAIAQGVPPLLRLLGLLPLEGQALAATLTLAIFAGGSLMAAAAIALLSMIADAADQHELLFGSRREGIYSAGYDFALKAAHGLGALVAGAILQLIDFPVELAERGGLSADLPGALIDRLGFFYGPGIACLTIAAALVTLRYRLGRRDHDDVLQQLRRIRAGLDKPSQRPAAAATADD